jgi:hypothetical protein
MNVTLSSSLTANSEILNNSSDPNNIYYYGLFEVILPVDGVYIFRSDSSINTYGILYKENFYPGSQIDNLIASNDNSGGNLQFQINVTLTSNTRYILVVTTRIAQVTGNFNLTVSGLNQVNLRQINSSSIISTTTTTIGK